MSAGSTAGKARRFERAVGPGASTLISVQVEPHAVCYLSHGDVAEHRLQLDADERGTVRFHASGPADAEPVEMLLEERQSDGTHLRHSVAMSTDVDHWDPPTNGGETRETIPALVEDPRELTSAQLVHRGYPPRPDPRTAPARYQRWRRLVSQEFTRVNDTKVEHSDVRFTLVQPDEVMSPTLPLPPPSEREVLTRVLRSALPLPDQLVDSMFNSSSSTWSGVYVTNPVNEFYVVEADWTVPRVFGNGFTPVYSATAKWVGLGNSGSDLFQAGTDSECFNILGWTFTTYWMWIEPLPYLPWSVPNFLVEPGDHVSVTIFIADQNGTSWFQENLGGGLTDRDNSVWFMLYNTTKGLSWWGTYPTVDAAGRFRFKGTSAEFILERPSSTKTGPYPLANFCATTMRNCAYADAQYGGRTDFPIQPDDGSQPFDGTQTYLNMDNPGTGHRLATAVSGQDAGSYGGNDIIWVYSNPL